MSPTIAPHSAPIHIRTEYWSKLTVNGQELDVNVTESREVVAGSLLPGVATFAGRGVVQLTVPGPRGPQQVPHQFSFPIPGSTIQEAFANFDKAQEPGFQAELTRLKALALRQGGTLADMPQDARDRQHGSGKVGNRG